MIRELGYCFGLIRYCVLCDGSINQAKARGYGFRPDRWRWHRRHDINGVAHGGLLPLQDSVPVALSPPTWADPTGYFSDKTWRRLNRLPRRQ